MKTLLSLLHLLCVVKVVPPKIWHVNNTKKKKKKKKKFRIYIDDCLILHIY